MTDTAKIYEGWAIVELMGHRRLGGYVTEVEIAGAAMLRVDVPEHPWQDGCTCGSEEPGSVNHQAHEYHCQMFREPGDDRPVDVHVTQFYSPAALYCLTPTTEQIARALRSRPVPVHAWELPRQPDMLLPASTVHARSDFGEDDETDDDLPL